MSEQTTIKMNNDMINIFSSMTKMLSNMTNGSEIQDNGQTEPLIGKNDVLHCEPDVNSFIDSMTKMLSGVTANINVSELSDGCYSAINNYDQLDDLDGSDDCSSLNEVSCSNNNQLSIDGQAKQANCITENFILKNIGSMMDSISFMTYDMMNNKYRVIFWYYERMDNGLDTGCTNNIQSISSKILNHLDKYSYDENIQIGSEFRNLLSDFYRHYNLYTIEVIQKRMSEMKVNLDKIDKKLINVLAIVSQDHH